MEYPPFGKCIVNKIRGVFVTFDSGVFRARNPAGLRVRTLCIVHGLLAIFFTHDIGTVAQRRYNEGSKVDMSQMRFFYLSCRTGEHRTAETQKVES